MLFPYRFNKIRSNEEVGRAQPTRSSNYNSARAAPTLRLLIEDYIFEDRVSASRRSGYARRGGQSPPYGKSLNSRDARSPPAKIPLYVWLSLRSLCGRSAIWDAGAATPVANDG